jgi:hypothetical protein
MRRICQPPFPAARPADRRSRVSPTQALLALAVTAALAQAAPAQRQFSDATATRMPIDNGASDMVLGDVDRDGDLDLVMSWGQNRLYLNDGMGTFTDATAARMPVNYVPTTCVALGDVDGDGDLDLVFG